MKAEIRQLATLTTIAITCAVMSGCGQVSESNQVTQSHSPTSPQPQKYSMSESAFAKSDEIVLAVNLGGSAYQANNGITYQADELDIPATTGGFDKVLGSQEPELYKSFREGQLDITFELENGEYDVLFHFAEPYETPVGERVFDVYANGEKVLKNLDIRKARDGNAFSALDRSVWGVKVDAGKLNIVLSAVNGEPVLNGLVVRKKHQKNENWRLVWQDEFDYSGAPDPKKWSFDEWPARKVNDEDQTYTSRAKNVRVEDNHLIIEAHKESLNNAEYTSGRIHTQGKMDFLYGRAEVRAKLPAGQGTWSAIWMLPSDPYKYSTTCQPGEDWQGSSTCDAWPNSGEIDIMEHVGYDMHNVHGTVHNKAYYWINWEQRKGAIEAQSVDSEFHVYAVEWTPEHITVLFNDTPYFTYLNEGTGWKAWPFDHPYHLILNLAIGGMWGRGGGPIDDQIFPVKMVVDYVRIYEKSAD